VSTRDDAEFREVLLSRQSEWTPAARAQAPMEVVDRVVRYRALVVLENQIQNLTRILEPTDFFESNVLDVVALLESGLLPKGPLFDLGSGCGVPGLLSACVVADQEWVLCDSEKKKAEFLSRAAATLGLPRVSTFGGRADEYLKDVGASYTVVSRAVGPVERLFNWIKDCSTWNRMVLLKGPSWQSEWDDFQRSARRNKLRIEGEYSYTSHGGKKAKRIVSLLRQPLFDVEQRLSLFHQ